MQNPSTSTSTYWIHRPFFPSVQCTTANTNKPQNQVIADQFYQIMQAVEEIFKGEIPSDFELRLLIKHPSINTINRHWIPFHSEREFRDCIQLSPSNTTHKICVMGPFRQLAKGALCELKPVAWRQEILSQDVAFAKMVNTGQKAIEEHKAEDDYKKIHYCMPDHIVTPSKDAIPQQTLLKFFPSIGVLKGIPKEMQDAHFTLRTEQGFLAGVFDGHGGSSFAKASADCFPILFQKMMELTAGHVHFAFETALNEIHKAFVDVLNDGCTAVITYIDQSSHLIYTATLGDGEAFICRTDSERSKRFIPLSCVRNWTSKSDRERGGLALQDDMLSRQFIKTMSELKRYYTKMQVKNKARFTLNPPHGKQGLNLSRTLGDFRYCEYKGKPVTVQKPKITVHQGFPEDIILIVSDGVDPMGMLGLDTCHLKSKVREDETTSLTQEIIDRVLNNWEEEQQYNRELKRDDVTAIAIRLE